MEIYHPNLNSLWADLIVEELLRTGVSYVVIAPGSRNSPLVAAFARNHRIKPVVHFDERGGAFHAVGYGRGTRKPAAVVCTSGTAAAELLPAVIEASRGFVPLLLLTADRPPELRHCGANQTIDQVKLFGGAVRWFFDVPCPAESIPPQAVLTLVDQAVYRAVGSPPGPVHLNCMFREPLAPTGPKKDFSPYLAPVRSWLSGDGPFTHYSPKRSDSSAAAAEVLRLLEECERGLLVFGELAGESQRRSARLLARRMAWPALPDILSGLRLGGSIPPFIPLFEHLVECKSFRESCRPDSVLQIGGPLVSKAFGRWMDSVRPSKYLLVADHPERQDPEHLVTHRFEVDPARFCDALAALWPCRSTEPWLGFWQRAEEAACRVISREVWETDRLSEPWVIWAVSRHIGAEHFLFFGNSLPIRQAGLFADRSGSAPRVGANRGASGIDGIVASASGMAAAFGAQGTVVLGDLSMLHDLNSLALVHKLALPLTLVVINNHGGGIFSLLPVSECKDIFDTFWVAPHSYSFEGVCRQFGIRYERPATCEAFMKAYLASFEAPEPVLIEVETDSAANKWLYDRIKQAVAQEVEKIR